MSDMHVLDGSISGQLTSNLTISASLEPIQNLQITSEIESLASAIDGTYDDGYEVASLLDEDYTIQTKNKLLKDDIVVKRLNYSETTNDSGGYTIYIG